MWRMADFSVLVHIVLVKLAQEPGASLSKTKGLILIRSHNVRTHGTEPGLYRTAAMMETKPRLRSGVCFSDMLLETLRVKATGVPQGWPSSDQF